MLGHTVQKAIERQLSAYWDMQAEQYDQLPGHDIAAPKDELAWASIIDMFIPVPSSVLDFGCGTGALTFVLHKMGHTVTGIDSSERMLDYARAKGEGDFRRAALEELSGPYDCVISRNVFWTLPAPMRTARTIAGLLRPGGKIITIDGNWYEGERYKNKTSHDVPSSVKAQLPLIRCDRPSADRQMLEKSGFSHIRIIPDLLKLAEANGQGKGLNSFDAKIAQFLVCGVRC